MARDHDDVEDSGRLESENMLRNRTNSKYLSDVVEQSSLDYNEAVEAIERDKKIVDSANDGFLNSLDLSMHGKMLDKTMERTNSNNLNRDKIHGKSTALLDSSDALLKLNRQVSSVVSDAASAHDSHAAFEQSVQAEKQHVKNILACGKRVVARELDGLEERSSPRMMRGSDEADADAKAIFGSHREQGRQNGDIGRPLKYMEKGVKKMTKGLDSDV